LSEVGVSLREHGGVYFVPARYQQTLDALCAVVEAAGNNRTSRRLIRQMEGDLRLVRTRRGIGTAFVISLPSVCADQDTEDEDASCAA